MGGMGLIFTPLLVGYLLGPPDLSRPMTSGSWTHSYSKQSNWRVWPASNFPPTPTTPIPSLLPPPLPKPRSFHPPLTRAIHDITVVVKKVAQNPAVLASYKRQ